MLRQLLDLLERNRRGGGYDRSRGSGGLLGRILGGSAGRGRYDDRRRYSGDDDDDWSRGYGRRRRRRGDDDDDDD